MPVSTFKLYGVTSDPSISLQGVSEACSLGHCNRVQSRDRAKIRRCSRPGISQQQEAGPGVGLEAGLELRWGWARPGQQSSGRLLLSLCYYVSHPVAQVVEFCSTEHVWNV